MPRTKLSRNTKRNRDAANEEMLTAVLRDYDSLVEQFFADFELKFNQDSKCVLTEISKFVERIPKKMLSITMGELSRMNIQTVDEFNEMMENSANSTRNVNMSAMRSIQNKKTRDDEGYLTEDSATNNQTMTRPRLPGPLSSAKAKGRVRRSRSACGYLTQPLSSMTSTKMTPAISSNSTGEHSSRSRYRTPMNNRVKAISADRAEPVTPKIAPNTPLSMLRYPKLGETVISLSGSPVVVQSVPDPLANVNIPIKNGMISLRPTKMQTIDPDIITKIDRETIKQMKQLQSNLNMIMNEFADRNL